MDILGYSMFDDMNLLFVVQASYNEPVWLVGNASDENQL